LSIIKTRQAEAGPKITTTTVFNYLVVVPKRHPLFITSVLPVVVNLICYPGTPMLQKQTTKMFTVPTSISVAIKTQHFLPSFLLPLQKNEASYPVKDKTDLGFSVGLKLFYSRALTLYDVIMLISPDYLYPAILIFP